MPIRDRRPRPAEPPENEGSSLARQIDTLQQLSSNYRDEVFGDNWFKDLRDFYNLATNPAQYPSFRPPVNVPQFQLLSVTEASDLADSNPKIYITKGDKRVKDRETALQSEWRDSYVNNQLMLASVWSLLNGNGYIQIGFDPYARAGKGKVWVRMRDPETVYSDAACTSEDDWYYLILEDRVWPEEVRSRFPLTGRHIKAEPPSAVKPADEYNAAHSSKLRVLPGPMSVRNPLNEQPQLNTGDGRVRLRYLYIFDGTVLDIAKDKAGSATKVDKLIPAQFELKWPNGRLVVECEGTILYDGDNPIPNRNFGLVRIQGMPALNSFYAPPPYRFVRGIQNVAERLFTAAFENAQRLNNGVWFIDENTGISAEDFGGIPAEVRIIASNARVPECKMPQAFPAHFLEYPKFLLSLEKELMGFSNARQGESGKGNVGVDLFDAAVFQSQSMTRMRAKLMAESVYRVAQQMFMLMAAYYKDYDFPDFSDEFQMRKWEKITNPQEFSLYLDPASVRPISQAAMQKMIPVMRKEGLLDTRTALEAMDFPGSGEISEQLEKEKALEAIARLKRR